MRHLLLLLQRNAIWAAAVTLVGLLALPLPAAAQSTCGCDREICTPDGFRKTLVDHHVDPLAGDSTFTYQLCVAAADGTCSDDASSCQDHQDCWNNRCQTGGPHAGTCSQDDATPCTGDRDCNVGVVCTGGANDCRIDKFQNLSHVDILLPDIGSCVSPTQEISISHACTANCPADLSCAVSSRDPSCNITNSTVLKCDVGANDIDPGECVTLVVKIAGETPTLGAGAIDEVTKVATTCTTDAICGPACGCAVVVDNCLTRTAGFWGTHPAITDQFDPITVCGKTLDTVLAGTCNSVTEALCIAPGTESRTCDKNPAYQQLVRQLAAAKLNLAATAANGGTCGLAIEATIANCEQLCGKTQNAISSSGCIQALDAFNNSQDTFAVTPSPFDRPGPADPSQCQAASGNGLVTGKTCRTANNTIFACR
jgi:hypothetical protein